jgi:arylsulfatase A-like enzyme
VNWRIRSARRTSRTWGVWESRPWPLAFGVLTLGLFGCSQGPSAPSLLLITVDTLRQDHVSAYGVASAKTPAIDRLAEQGVLFENHYTVVGLTEPAHVTLFTGLYPRQHGVRRNGLRLPANLPLLAETLAQAGYRTGASIGSGVLGSEFGLARGFASFAENFDTGNFDRGHARTGAYERFAEAVIDDALSFIAAPSDESLFLWVHLFDPHAPYLRDDAELPATEELLAGGAVFAEANEFQQADQIEKMRRGYAAEVRYTDAQVGRLVDAWDARMNGAENLVIFTADHGEALGEHSYIGHSFYLYEEQIRVPLILRMPSELRAGRRVSSTTSVIDVAATILELLSIDEPHPHGGKSLIQWLHGADPNPNSFAIAERPALPSASKLKREGKTRPADWSPKALQDRLVKHHEGRAGGGALGLVAWIRGQQKYIWSEDAEDELFLLSVDPLEQANRIDQAGPSNELQALVESWQAATPALYRAPKDKPSQGKSTEEMLNALGYGGEEDE